MIAQALHFHEATVNRHISDYLNHRKLKPETEPVTTGVSW